MPEADGAADPGSSRAGGRPDEGPARGAAAAGHRVRAWLRLARISNLPTTWTNVLVGAALVSTRPDVDGLVVAAAATGLLYVGGMILNDVVDARRDAARGLDRPIPAGAVRRGTAAAVAIGLLLAGPVVASAAGPVAAAWAVALAACVVGYDLLKERAAVALALMGACRGLVAPLAAAAQPGSAPLALLLAVSLGLAASVLLITVAARGEHDGGGAGRRRIHVLRDLAAALPVVPVALLGPGAAEAGPIAGLLPAAVLVAAAIAWNAGATRRLRAGGSVPAAVMRWLAGICLFDLAIVAAAGIAPPWLVVPVLAFTLTRLAHRRIAGS